jgi:hypothetical protein
MKLQGRKFWSWIVGVIFLVTMVIVVIIGALDPAYVSYFIAVIACFTLLTMAFIGGTVWKDYIKSKHFKPELFNGDK